MTDTESKAIQAKGKTEAATPAEQTRPGFVFTPAVDIFETDKEITLLADMPGVRLRISSLTSTRMF
jgi:HSP20 family molecular chaperone IbpA